MILTGDILHFENHYLFLKPGDGFHPHISPQIPLPEYTLNCFKFSHNFPFNPKSTSTPTSVKPLYFLSKLNFQTIKNHPFLPIKT